MQKYTDLVLGNNGQSLQPVAGASVLVLNYPGGGNATIYSDNGITIAANPLTTDNTGRFSFYAANGRYTLQATVGGSVTQTLIDFPLENDPASPTTVNITGGTIANVAISNSTATTQGPLENTGLIATDLFVANQIIRSKATQPVTITGGTYNLNVTGTGLTAILTAAGGIISAVAIGSGGTGYAVGDTLVVTGGNVDSIVRVTAVSSGVVTTLQVLYGGTGYTNGVTSPCVKAGINGGNVITLTGVLTSNATIIFVRGTPLTSSSRVIINNNTTGAFTVSVFVSNGSGGTTGSGVVIPQGSNNSSAVILQTDGQTDIWTAVSGALIPGRLINTQIFTASGTYTPTIGVKTAIIEGCGGGGGGGGGSTTTAAQVSVGGGGSSGAFGKVQVTAPTSQTVTIGAAGTAGAAGNNNGGPGGQTSIGTYLVCPGGGAGNGGAASTFANTVIGGFAVGTNVATSSATAIFLSKGQQALLGSSFYNLPSGTSGGGGSTPYGSGGPYTGSGAGANGSGFGAGGSGAFIGASGTQAAGGAGTAGFIVVYEYS